MKPMSKAAAVGSTSSAVKAEEFDSGIPLSEVKQELPDIESAANVDLSLSLGGLYCKMEERSPLITQGSSSSSMIGIGEVKTIRTENPSRRANVVKVDTNITAMELSKLMPSVKTVGDKPNGKYIEGFLSNYENGPITIVCVCHGKTMSPSEFVQHAGGEGLDNPMKYIKVVTTL